MVIKGFQRVSLVDHPGKVAAVVFVAGCNFRCPYCHNRDLVLDSDLEIIPEEKIFDYLGKRKGVIEGVVITGGEPTLQKDLPDFAKKIKDLGLLVKLDTNGSNTSALCSAVVNDLFDYVALDIKAPLDERYRRIVGDGNFEVSFIRATLAGLTGLSSMKELVASGTEYELRTTVVPGLHSEEDLLDLAKQLSEIAPRAKWFLQNFQPKNCLDPEFEKIEPYDNIFIERVTKKLKVYMPLISSRS